MQHIFLQALRARRSVRPSADMGPLFGHCLYLQSSDSNVAEFLDDGGFFVTQKPKTKGQMFPSSFDLAKI